MHKNISPTLMCDPNQLVRVVCYLFPLFFFFQLFSLKEGDELSVLEISRCFFQDIDGTRGQVLAAVLFCHL